MRSNDAGKGDDNRSDSKKYRANYDKVDYSKPVSTTGFKLTVNGKDVK